MPSKTMSIKIDEDLERSLQEIANREQTMSGDKVTLSDVVRNMLSEGVQKETGHIRTDVMPLSEPYTPVGRRILMPIHKGEGAHEVGRNPTIKARVGSRIRPLTHQEMEEKAKREIEITYAGQPEHIKQRILNQISNVTGEHLMIPTFDISANPTWHWSEGLVNEQLYIEEAKKSISIKEDEEIIKCVSNGVPAEHTLCIAGPDRSRAITVKAYRNDVLTSYQNFDTVKKATAWILELAETEGVVTSLLDTLENEEDLEVVVDQVNAWMIPLNDEPLKISFRGFDHAHSMSVSAGLIWEHQVDLTTVVYHPYRFSFVDAWRQEQKGVEWPLENRVEDVAFLPTIACPRDTIYLLSKPELCGRVVIETDVNVIEANDPLRLTMGRMVWESIGVALINDYCTSKIVIV